MAFVPPEARLARGVMADRFGIEGAPTHGPLSLSVSARDRLYERGVTLELPRPAIADDPVLLARFVEGARAAMAIEHAGVVRVLGVEYDADGFPFVVRERVRGALLSERATPMTLDAAWQILDPVIEALAVAHALGLVHGALRPAQIVLHENARGALRPKIGGFGSAPLLSTVFQGTGPVAPRYAAPELFRGAPPTPASDVWSIGVIACELLSGEHPIAGVGTAAPADLSRVITGSTPRPLARLVPQAPPAVTHALDRALAVLPEARWPNAGALQTMLVDHTRAMLVPPGAAAARSAALEAGHAAPAPARSEASPGGDRDEPAGARAHDGGAERRDPSEASRRSAGDDVSRHGPRDDERDAPRRDGDRREPTGRSARDDVRREPTGRSSRDDDERDAPRRDDDRREPTGRARRDDDERDARGRGRDDDRREPTGRARQSDARSASRSERDDARREPSARSRSARRSEDDDDDVSRPPPAPSRAPWAILFVVAVALGGAAIWFGTGAGTPAAPETGAVVIGNLPAGASPLVDGTPRAPGERGRLELSGGPHRIEVTGFSPLDVEVTPGATLRVELAAAPPVPPPTPAPPEVRERSRCFGAWRGGFDCEGSDCDVRLTLVLTSADAAGTCGTLGWSRDGGGSGRADLGGCAIAEHAVTFEEPSSGAMRRVSMRCTEARTTVSAYDSEEGESRSGGVRRDGEAPPEATLVTPPPDAHPCHGSWSGFSGVTGANVRLDLDALGDARCGRVVDEGTFSLTGCELDGSMLEARSELGNFSLDCAADESGATMRSSAWGTVTLSPR